jgi:hypothetical protein
VVSFDPPLLAAGTHEVQRPHAVDQQCAVGGGWSFTDASLPGAVATNRPDYNAADAMAGLLPLAEGFPPDGEASIASLQANDSNLISRVSFTPPVPSTKRNE